jgi:hypothetical protein
MKTTSIDCAARWTSLGVAIGLLMFCFVGSPARAIPSGGFPGGYQYENGGGMETMDGHGNFRGGGPIYGGGGGGPCIGLATQCFDQSHRLISCDCQPIVDCQGDVTGYSCPTQCYNNCGEVEPCALP